MGSSDPRRFARNRSGNPSATLLICEITGLGIESHIDATKSLDEGAALSLTIEAVWKRADLLVWRRMVQAGVGRFIEGSDRRQRLLLPDCTDDYPNIGTTELFLITRDETARETTDRCIITPSSPLTQTSTAEDRTPDAISSAAIRTPL